MKKVFIPFLFLIITGCTASGTEYKCTVDGKEATITMNEGTITSYVINGEKVSKQDLDEINGLYLTGATNNEEGLNLFNKYLQDKNGHCS